MQSVIALAGFARTECEQELRVIHSRRETSLSSRVLAVLQAHPAGLTKVEIVGALGCGPLSRNSLETALETLVRRREVCVERSAQGKAFRYVACADGG